MRAIKLFLVDDHKLIRDGIKLHFEEDPLYEVIGEAGSGEEALERLKTIDPFPDIILMDINMDRMDGIVCTKEVCHLYPSVKVIGLTMLSESHYIKEMIRVGASGYLLKNCTESDLKNAIQAVFNGQNYYSPAVTNIIMNSLGAKNNTTNNRRKNKFEIEIPLTNREKEVLELIIKEYSNQEIADALFISRRTVDAHKRNLLEKTGAKNIAGLVVYAISNKLFDEI